MAGERDVLAEEIVAYYKLYDFHEVWRPTGARALVDWLAARGWRLVPEPAGDASVTYREGWEAGHKAGLQDAAPSPEPLPREALDVERLARALDEIAEGTEPDRIGQYGALRDWVHRTARAALSPDRPTPP